MIPRKLFDREIWSFEFWPYGTIFIESTQLCILSVTGNSNVIEIAIIAICNKIIIIYFWKFYTILQN